MGPLVPAREFPSRGEALGFSLAAVAMVYYTIGMVFGLVEGRWQLHDLAGHIAFGIGVVAITLWVSRRAIQTWGWRRRALSGSEPN
jgi:hypothetical protein